MMMMKNRQIDIFMTTTMSLAVRTCDRKLPSTIYTIPVRPLKRILLFNKPRRWCVLLVYQGQFISDASGATAAGDGTADRSPTV